MRLEGGCYCKDVRYSVEGDPVMKAQCHCRECQYIAGGSPAVLLGMPASGFKLEKGATKSFTRTDIENPVTREFCPNCGTHLLTRAPNFPLVLLKVGGLDDPAVFEGPDVVFFTCDMQPFHRLPEGVPAHERLPSG
jgi:hypothetical protein